MDRKSIEFFNPKALVSHLQALVQKKIWLKIFIALILGVVVGAIIKENQNYFSPIVLNSIINWVGFPGKLFLALIQMIVIPLVFASVVRGIAASNNVEQLRKLGLRVGVYFILTTAISITIGFTVSSIIRPGHEIHLKNESAGVQAIAVKPDVGKAVPIDTIPIKLVDLLPQNPLVAMTEGQMLQIVLLAIIIGFAILSIPSKQAEPILIILGSTQEICMAIVKWAMYLAPLAVFGLLAEATAKAGAEALIGMAGYVSSVLLGLFGVLIFYLILVSTLGRMNPIYFLKKIRQVQLLAFSTSSSAAVMPMTLETAEKDLGVEPSVARFIIPLGTTINMDGTALYQGVATIFLAHTAGIDLDLGSMLLVVVTAIGASIGSPGTPGVGIVILAGLLTNIGVPSSGIALILGVDRVLDMARTVINVTGDLTASIVMNSLMKKQV